MWTPKVANREGPIYRAIVQALQDDVGRGHLQPGARLPTQRALADALKITVSTVTRAYGEAKRIGLIEGEVGRGTYVRQQARKASRNGGEQSDAEFIDLMLNRPALGALDVHLRESLSRLVNEQSLEGCLDYPPVGGFDWHRAAGAEWVARAGVRADAGQVVVCSGAQQALMAALSALAQPGTIVATEALNYPGIRRVAEFLNLQLVALPMDGDGIDPDGFARACAKHAVRVLVCTPCHHNPTTATLPLERRRRILEIAARHGVAVIEDDVHGPVAGGSIPALFTLSGGKTVYISSVSKAMAPGLRVGYLVASSSDIVRRSAEVVHTSTWGTPRLIGDIVSDWITEGIADRFIAHHVRCAEERVMLARDVLEGTTMRSSTGCYHAWLELPSGAQPDDFAMTLRLRNVATTPGTWFSIDGSPVRAIRLSLGSPGSMQQLEIGLHRIADVLRGRTPAPLI